MDKQIVTTAVIFIGVGILLGAFTAHSLENVLSNEMIGIFEKGVKYQMITGLGLLAVGLSADKIPFDLKWFYWLSLLGVIVFSGGLYVLAFHELSPALRYFGAIIPIGGSMMIVAWLIFLFRLIRMK